MYEKCTLCARNCQVNRKEQYGYCRMNEKIHISRASLHMWEEPPISGERGSGTVFFSGCSLGCIYCQNHEISRGESGIAISEERLSEIFLELQEKQAHNINLVTPTHFVPSIINAVSCARLHGLRIPIVYNTSAYENISTLEILKDSVDIWLPDLKYYKNSTAKKYSKAENLPEISRKAIDKMISFAPHPVFDEDGIMKKGVIVRILLLPGHLAEAKLNVKYLYEKYKNDIYISLMSQYTPIGNMPSPLDRRVTLAEYRELVDYAEKIGVVNAFIQERDSAEESFIPPFDYTGVL